MLATEAWSTAQAAEYLKVTPRTLRRYVTSGKLPARKLPGATGSYVFDPADVRAYLTRTAAEGELRNVAGPGRCIPAPARTRRTQGTYSN